MPAQYTPEEVKKAHEVLFAEGIKMREKVAGKAFVEKSLAGANNPFARAMQEVKKFTGSLMVDIANAPEFRLELKTRSFLNIALLCNQNRGTELATHVKGALNNGATPEEIREVILQAACYCGMPAGVEGFRVSWKAVEEWNEEQRRQGHTVDDHQDVGLADRVAEPSE